ncbi:MAG: hypothetical protein EXQ85_00435 [Alphaproteobacteria bacterium]|nr:hypothetical protein [Alphaproteobacteria bacterium]
MDQQDDDEPREPSGWVTDWLIRKGLTRGSVTWLIDGFCRRISESGIPLWRLNYIVQTLHLLNRAAIVL